MFDISVKATKKINREREKQKNKETFSLVREFENKKKKKQEEKKIKPTLAWQFLSPLKYKCF